MSANPLSASEPWNLVADGYGYAETTMLVFEQFAEVAYATKKIRLRHYLTTYILNS
jgi:hypothetical protein